MGANKSANAVYILILEKWAWEEKTLEFPFSSPLPPTLMSESEVLTRMITSVYSIWYLNFGTQKERPLFCDGRKLKSKRCRYFGTWKVILGANNIP